MPLLAVGRPVLIYRETLNMKLFSRCSSDVFLCNSSDFPCAKSAGEKPPSNVTLRLHTLFRILTLLLYF